VTNSGVTNHVTCNRNKPGNCSLQHQAALRRHRRVEVDDNGFENTSTNVAASQMRNALNKLADTVTNPEEKKVRINPSGGQISA
jgi:hypothetical protein